MSCITHAESSERPSYLYYCLKSLTKYLTIPASIQSLKSPLLNAPVEIESSLIIWYQPLLG